MMEMRRTECNSELVRCEYKFTSSAITSDNEYKFRVEKRGNGNGLLQGSGQGSLWGPLGFPHPEPVTDDDEFELLLSRSKSFQNLFCKY